MQKNGEAAVTMADSDFVADDDRSIRQVLSQHLAGMIRSQGDQQRSHALAMGV